MKLLKKQEDIKLNICIFQYKSHVVNNHRIETSTEMTVGYKYEDIESMILHMAWGTSYKFFEMTEEEILEHYILEHL